MHHRYRTPALLAASLALMGACDRLPSEAAPPAGPSEARAETVVDGIQQDAAVYASTYGVSPQEAARRLQLQEAVDYIDRECRGAEAVAIVSASIDNWVRPFADMYLGKADGVPPVTVIGTQVETADGVLTGRFATPNCYGAEKVRRVREALGDCPDAETIAFGDSRGDKELLEYADKGYYKPFRN